MIKKIFKTKFLSVLLIFTLVLPCLFTTPVMAATPYPNAASNAAVSSALAYLQGQQTATGEISDFATSAWAVMAIKAAGQDPNSWKVGSNPSIVDYLSTNAASATTTNDYSRMILAIAAAGKDPTNFGGINFLSLLEGTYNNNQIGDSTLLNDDYWGVMALVAAGVSPASSNVIQGSVSFILSNQNTDGGWSYGVGQSSDADDTAAAIMALLAAGQSASSTPITNALAYIKSTQADDGGFVYSGSTNSDSATDSWAIASIVAAGQDPTGTAWQYSSTGKDPVDDLLSFQNADGSFNWTSATPSNLASMTSYAIVALLGTRYPVATLTPETTTTTTTPATAPVTVGVRIEGQSDTIWNGTVTVNESTITDSTGAQHQLDQPTALGALDAASKAGGFPYVVNNSSYGLYISSINGEDAAGQAGWTYWVDGYSPMAGVADFILDQTTPPTPPHQEILFAYAEAYTNEPLKVEVSDTTPSIGNTFTVTVEKGDGAGNWSPAAGATVYADKSYTTAADGTVAISINSNLTVKIYAEENGYIRSNQVTVTVTGGAYVPPTTTTTINTPTTTTNWGLIGGIIGAVIVIGIVATVVLKRRKTKA